MVEMLPCGIAVIWSKAAPHRNYTDKYIVQNMEGSYIGMLLLPYDSQNWTIRFRDKRMQYWLSFEFEGTKGRAMEELRNRIDFEYATQIPKEE